MENLKVIQLVSNDFEDLELWVPVYRLREEGIQVDLVGPEKNKKYIGKYGVPAVSDYSFDEINPEDYDGILVPGGWSPDLLRRYDKVLEMVKYFDAQKLPVGQICHAGWVLASADILQGVNITSTPGIKDDLKNAGAIWHDVGAIEDGHIISAQRPVNLPEYTPLLVKAFKAIKK